MAASSEPEPIREKALGGKYSLIRLLGQGGMGAVYEAENTWTKRRVAVKVMRPEAANVPDAVRRFMQEAQSAAQIGHDNIVDVLDMGQDAETGEFFIVQEFLVGQDLRGRLKAQRRLSQREAFDVIVPVMEALVVAHGRGIVHRDLKPENIFLAETTRGIVPKVIDFGIAKVTQPDGDNPMRTGTGQLVGTPCYMSQEQAAGESDIDARSDVWSIGVVLYEMLSGTLPFRSDKIGMLMAQIITGQPRPLGEVAPQLPRRLREIVDGAIRPRDERPPSMQAFLDAIVQYRATAGEGLDATASGATTSDGQATMPPSARVSTGLGWSGHRTTPPTSPPRRATVWLAGGIALGMGVLFGGVAIERHLHPGHPEPAGHPAEVSRSPAGSPGAMARPTPNPEPSPTAAPSPSPSTGVVAPVPPPSVAVVHADPPVPPPPTPSTPSTPALNPHGTVPPAAEATLASVRPAPGHRRPGHAAPTVAGAPAGTVASPRGVPTFTAE